MRRLIVNPDTESAWEIPLKTGMATLGREEGNDIVINHPSVSGSHCELMVTDSMVTVTDLNSDVGTFIDGQAANQSILQPGQILQVGEVRIRLEAATEPAPAEVFTSGDKCRLHLLNPARYHCPQCQKNFCEICVNTRQSKTFCRTCAVECLPLTPEPEPDEIMEPSFFKQILGAFRYPLKGDGIMLIVVGTVFFLLLNGARAVSKYAFIYGWIAFISLTVFGIGYLTSYLRHILTATATGENEMPDWPEMTDLSSEVFSPFWQLFVTVIFCFAPAIALTIFAATLHGHGDTSWLGWATTAAIVLGCVYFPMAFMAVAMFDSVGGVNPLLIIPSIQKVLREYVLTVVVLAIILVLRWLLKNYLSDILPVPLLPTIISSLLGLYLLIVEVRILGLLYRNNKYELSWFS